MTSIDGYTVTGTLLWTKEKQVEVAESATTGNQVVIKSFCFRDIDSINDSVREGLVQARVDHFNNCRLIEVRLQKEKGDSQRCCIHLVMEKLDSDLETSIRERLVENPYSEEDIFRFLRQVGAGLSFAKQKVLDT